MTDVHETIKDIKSKFRLFMNGKVSQSMREKGLDYKLNFGIEYPRIKEIASGYDKDHALAQALWKEPVRECKIMAGLLQPVDTFYPEIADIWIEDMHYPEIAEYTVMNLFQHLPYASDSAFKWMADERMYFRLCGLLLMARLLMKGGVMNERAEAEFLDQAGTALEGDAPVVQKAAALALRKYALQSDANFKQIQRQLHAWEASTDSMIQGLANEIKNEIEYQP